jgi:hypothetical protein
VKLRLQPIWGHGWSNATRAFEVPAEFDLEVSEVLRDRNDRLLGTLGQVDEPKHQLAGFWVLLTARHREDSGYYNLEAFNEKPDLAERLACVMQGRRSSAQSNLAGPQITGFVLIEKRST